MKMLLGKLSIAALIIVVLTTNCSSAFAASTIKVNGRSHYEPVLVYDRNSNPIISITPQSNAIGHSFTLFDEYGNVVKKGIIRSGKTFYLETKELKNGSYRFHVGTYNVQEFIVK